MKLPDPEAKCGWEGIWPSTAACVSVTQRVDLRQLPLGPVGEVWSEQVQRVFFDKEAERAELLKRPSEILLSCSVLLGHSVSTSFLVWDLEACCTICKRKKKDGKLTSTSPPAQWIGDLTSLQE